MELAPWVGLAGMGVEASSPAAVVTVAGSGVGGDERAPVAVGASAKGAVAVGASPLMPNSFTRVGSTR